MNIGTDCSGVGAPEQAMDNLGVPYKLVFACEKDKYARKTFAANHNPGIFFEDLTTRAHDGIEQLDIYIAGYPCQAFSNAGERGGENDPRGTIFYHGLEFMKKNRPRAFVLENVPGMLNVKGVNILSKWLELLAKTVNDQAPMFPNPDNLGYRCYWKILNTLDYGIPQNRERVFIVGLRDDCDTFSFPPGIVLNTTLYDILETNVSKKYYLNASAINRILSRNKNYLPRINPATTGTIGTENNSGSTIDAGTTLISEPFCLRWKNSVDGVVPSKHIPSLRANPGMDIRKKPVIVINNGGHLEAKENFTAVDANYYKGMDNARQRSFILAYTRSKDGEVNSQHLKETANTLHSSTGGGGNTDQYVVPKLDLIGTIDGKNTQGQRIYSPAVATTLNTSDGGLGGSTGLYLVEGNIRRLTPRECFRLQGFPDRFDISHVSETQQYKQAGNSMTVAVIQSILYKIIAGRK